MREKKMICIDHPCDSCIHQRENIDGWKCACDAFPDGIPVDYMLKSDPSKQKECNNGIGYEKKSDEQSSTMHPHGAFSAFSGARGQQKTPEAEASGAWCARRDLNPHVRSGH